MNRDTGGYHFPLKCFIYIFYIFLVWFFVSLLIFQRCAAPEHADGSAVVVSRFSTSHDCVNCSNVCCSHALWFTASRVIVTSSHVPKSKHISHRNILAAYQNPLKDSCCVYDGVSRLLASGFKEAPQNKGRWRMTWPSSAVWNHSQVTCVFVHPLHLEVLENGVDSTQRCKEPSYRPPCRSRCVLSSFFFF